MHTHTYICTLYTSLSYYIHSVLSEPPLIQEGVGSVRFVSVPDFSEINRFGSVRFGKQCFPVRCGSACVFRTRRGSVRFDSFLRPVPAGSRIIRFCSVRFGQFGSVSYSFLLIIRTSVLLRVVAAVLNAMIFKEQEPTPHVCRCRVLSLLVVRTKKASSFTRDLSNNQH